MANNFKAYEYFIGFRFSALELEEQSAVRKGMREGYLRIEPGTRIVRAIPQPDPALPVHNGRHWA
jgi:hypothetical protein